MVGRQLVTNRTGCGAARPKRAVHKVNVSGTAAMTGEAAVGWGGQGRPAENLELVYILRGVIPTRPSE